MRTKCWTMAALGAVWAAAAWAAPVRETLDVASDWVHDVAYEYEDGAVNGTLSVRL